MLFSKNYLSKKEELNLAEKQSLKTYLRAIKTIKEAGVIDMARCAMSFGRQLSGKPLAIWQALPVVIGRGVSRPNRVDLDYARVLLAYSENLQLYKTNMKDFVLKFALNF